MSVDAYLQQSTVTCSGSFFSAAVLADPATVLFAVTDPSGVVTTHTYADGSGVVVRDGIGLYHAVVTASLTGIYTYGFSATATPAYETYFLVYPQTATTFCLVTGTEVNPDGTPNAGATLFAYPLSDGLYTNDGVNWGGVTYGRVPIVTNSFGQWFVALPWSDGTHSDPATQTWALTRPSGLTYGGLVPSLLGPFTIKDLKDGHAWGIVATSGATVAAIQGPQGIQGPPTLSLPSLVFPGFQGTPEVVITIFNPDGSITRTLPVEGVTETTSFNPDGSISDVFTGAIARTVVTRFAGSTITETVT